MDKTFQMQGFPKKAIIENWKSFLSFLKYKSDNNVCLLQELLFTFHYREVSYYNNTQAKWWQAQIIWFLCFR